MLWQLDVTVDFTCHIRLIACCTSVLSRNLDHYNGNETPINLICLPLSQLWAYSGILPRIKIIDVNVLSRHRTINFRYFSHISFPFKIKILSVILLAFLVSKRSLSLWVQFSFQIAWYNPNFLLFRIEIFRFTSEHSSQVRWTVSLSFECIQRQYLFMYASQGKNLQVFVSG